MANTIQFVYSRVKPDNAAVIVKEDGTYSEIKPIAKARRAVVQLVHKRGIGPSRKQLRTVQRLTKLALASNVSCKIEYGAGTSPWYYLRLRKEVGEEQVARMTGPL